jgi:hypothetical protein
MQIEINELDLPSLQDALEAYRDANAAAQNLRAVSEAEKEIARREFAAATRLLSACAEVQ